MGPEKIEALLVTDRRSFNSPKIVFGEHKVAWRIKYTGEQLDQRLSFSKHHQIATNKAIQSGDNLARLVPNIGGPKEAIKRLVASVVHSKLLYIALV